ncbi:MAG TPA: UvrD-helicase domain-containing protein [Candidatus Paceibacterota bacterium]|nr:UvrD-helicase domain-containing protein [Candidatus Paceibacterota bacterium]
MNYLEGLNDRQKEAVLHRDGPLLIVAGAGAGKTKTITHRIAHLVESGVPAHQILAVTFTNKAAGEMRERVWALVPQGHGAPLVCTFHSLGVRLLREFAQDAGLPRAFVIWDRDDSQRALKKILESLDEGATPRAALARISREKGKGISAKAFAEEAKDFRDRRVAQVWTAYEKVLTEEGALDFDDLLLRTLALLQNSPRVLDLLQARWQYLTIDEYQDTNGVQYEIARLLAGKRRNICVVGDIDQNIYSWRGAELEHLLQFETAFPGTKVVTLEQNYRSTRTILAAANAIIEKNSRRKPKNLFTENDTGASIVVFAGRNELEEAWFISAEVARLIERGTPPGKIAVLYRENFLSRALEEAMLAAGLPYRVLGTRFFERKEVKDTISYLRAAMNPKSRVDLLRIVGVPPRGIGKVTLDKMLAGEDAALAGAAKTKVDAFRMTLAAIKQAIDVAPASEAVKFALEASGMEKMFKNDKEEGGERLENVRELVNFAARFDDQASPEGVERLIEEAALQSEQDSLQERENSVSLMTVHASKGLEFDAVFVAGLEQGLFPSIRADDSNRDPEEERRLFYVALTRAGKRLFLSYARERLRWGTREFTLPSEFIGDIDQRLLSSPQEAENDEEIIEIT